MGKRIALTVVVAIVAIVVPGTALAHVTIDPGEAAPGGFATLTFRVPNERDDASTSSVEVNFPTDAVIPFVSVRPVPGWEVAVERRTLDEPVESEGGEIDEVVATVTWTGGPIEPGQFQVFEVSAGPLPEDVDALVFPTLQTYDSGEVVRWIDETPPGGEEPEHPAPSVRLVAADDEPTTTTAGAATTTVPDDDGAEAAEGGDDEETDALAVVALVVGILGVLLGGTALALRRRA
jgi:uncharacterized protein YcnI